MLLNFNFKKFFIAMPLSPQETTDSLVKDDLSSSKDGSSRSELLKYNFLREQELLLKKAYESLVEKLETARENSTEDLDERWDSLLLDFEPYNIAVEKAKDDYLACEEKVDESNAYRVDVLREMYVAFNRSLSGEGVAKSSGFLQAIESNLFCNKGFITRIDVLRKKYEIAKENSDAAWKTLNADFAAAKDRADAELNLLNDSVLAAASDVKAAEVATNEARQALAVAENRLSTFSTTVGDASSSMLETEEAPQVTLASNADNSVGSLQADDCSIELIGTAQSQESISGDKYPWM